MPEILETNPTAGADVKKDEKLECVGSLLIPTHDVEELSKSPTKEESSPNKQQEEGVATTLRRRITEALNAPPPENEADLDPRDWID
jgi:hypothetical protein